MSLLKEVDKANGREPSNQLYYGRMLQDSMPHRGPYAHLREEEYEELAETVYDFAHQLFDLSNEEHNKLYNEINEHHVNGWYVVYFKEHKLIEQADGTVKVFVYCEWGIPHKQLDLQRAATFGPVLN